MPDQEAYMLYWYYHKIKRDNARTIASCEEGEAQCWKSWDTKNFISSGSDTLDHGTESTSLPTILSGGEALLEVFVLLWRWKLFYISLNISGHQTVSLDIDFTTKLRDAILGRNRVVWRVKLNAGNLGIRRTSSRADYSATFEKLKYASAFCFQRREC